LKWERLNLSAIAAEVVKEESMIDQAHDFQAELDQDIFVEGDAGLIKQLLRILSDNSIKYTDGGGRITVTLERGDQARLTVRDEGAGIPSEILPHIFDRFVRADESRTRNTGGAGLGLSIAKWIVDRHGGYFEVVSREGLGTKMTVVLPLSENTEGTDVMGDAAATDVAADVVNVTAP
jgi:signal transduction histidine kinase